MRTLAIDCATEACSVALFANGALLDGACRQLGRGHAEALVPMIANLPGQGRADRIAVALGPGSFTGVRVGLAAARALAFAWNAELVGYPTLALVAAMAQAERGAVPVAVVNTGGHGEWFVQRFAANADAISELAALAPEAAADQICEALVAGSQAAALVARRGSGEALELWPDARALLQLPDGTLLAEVQPLYGRAPDARLPDAQR